MRRAFSVDIDNIDRGGEHWKKLGYLQIKGGQVMEELTKRLIAVSDSYYDFVAGIRTYCQKKPERLENVLRYMDDNPGADTSDIIEFVSEQDDFYEDAVPYQESAVYQN